MAANNEEYPQDAASFFVQNITEDFFNRVAVSKHLPPQTTFSPTPLIPIDPNDKIGIIGAGVGGLYAAMILQSLSIPFEILEATGDVGGRLYTYHFSEEENDYYDVGAMRIPDNPMMKRVFDLFKRLRMSEAGGDLFTYLFKNPNTTLEYNNILRQNISGQVITAKDFDVEGIDEKYGQLGWDYLFNLVINPFKLLLKEDLLSGGKSRNGQRMLMKYDRHSVRSYMVQGPETEDVEILDPNGMLPYPGLVVNWIETFAVSSGAFNVGLSDMVIVEGLAFDWPISAWEDEVAWYAIRGGSNVLAQNMLARLRQARIPQIGREPEIGKEPEIWLNPNFLKLNARVTEIGQIANMPLIVSWVDQSSGKEHSSSFAHVITTTTLPCLQTMDLTRANLTTSQSTSIRELQYGPATKFGVKFKSPWWEVDNPSSGTAPKFGPIKGGVSYTDRMTRMTIYPSYETNVLIASYTWTNDALKTLALLGEESEAMFKNLVCRDLVAIHGLDPDTGMDFLRDQWVDSYGLSWSASPKTIGGYALFGPGQFSDVYLCLKQPAGRGRLHFAGEAISQRHAWIVGALDASWNAVHAIVMESYPDKLNTFIKLWGRNAGAKDTDVLKLLALSQAGFEYHGLPE